MIAAIAMVTLYGRELFPLDDVRILHAYELQHCQVTYILKLRNVLGTVKYQHPREGYSIMCADTLS